MQGFQEHAHSLHDICCSDLINPNPLIQPRRIKEICLILLDPTENIRLYLLKFMYMTVKFNLIP